MAILSLAVAALAATAWVAEPKLEAVRSYAAPEARQGVAVDADHFYAITNRTIGKYRIDNGERVAKWQDPEGGTMVHLNGGIVMDGALYGFHSNFPKLPMTSSLEVFDLKDLRHRYSIPLGVGHGSLVWAIPHPKTKQVWVCYGHYNGNGGTPGIGNEQSRIVVYDRTKTRTGEVWREAGGYSFPPDLVSRWDGMTASGAVFLDADRILATGHHAPELHVLRIPTSGAMLKLEKVIESPCHGQGVAIGADGSIWQIHRPDAKVHRFRLVGLE